MSSDTQTSMRMAQALEDGFIDDREAEQILALVRKEEAVLELIKTRLQFKTILPDEIRAKAQSRKVANIRG